MTVQELIDDLQEIEDKTRLVKFNDYERGNIEITEVDHTTLTSVVLYN